MDLHPHVSLLHSNLVRYYKLMLIPFWMSVITYTWFQAAECDKSITGPVGDVCLFVYDVVVFVVTSSVFLCKWFLLLSVWYLSGCFGYTYLYINLRRSRDCFCFYVKCVLASFFISFATDVFTKLGSLLSVTCHHCFVQAVRMESRPKRQFGSNSLLFTPFLTV